MGQILFLKLKLPGKGRYEQCPQMRGKIELRNRGRCQSGFHQEPRTQISKYQEPRTQI